MPGKARYTMTDGTGDHTVRILKQYYNNAGGSQFMVVDVQDVKSADKFYAVPMSTLKPIAKPN